MRFYRVIFYLFYWKEIKISALPSYLTRVALITFSISSILVFVALFYDPREAHSSPLTQYIVEVADYQPLAIDPENIIAENFFLPVISLVKFCDLPHQIDPPLRI